jgi:hypothetical protein
MRYARRDFEALASTDIEPRTADLQYRLALKNVKELPRLRMIVAALAIPWRHALLNYAQVGPIE